MPAYLIADINVLDEDAFAAQREQVEATLVRYNGRFLVRGGRAENLEGEWRPGRMGIIEFPSMEAARSWWNSPEYEEIKRLRKANGEIKMIIAEGITSNV